MKRLRDQRGSADPVLARAAELVSARAPLEDDAVRRQRVRARLRRRRTAPRGAAWLRAAAMLLLVCSVAVASAMIGRVAQTIRAHLEEARAARQEQHAHGHRHHATATAPNVASAPNVATAPNVAPAPNVATATNAATAPNIAPTPAAAPAPNIATVPNAVTVPNVARATIAAPTPSPPPHRAPAVSPPSRESDEQRLLVDAVRALRHEHDPARAERLLERYLDRFPDAVAAEDALALALEATIGRDPPRAAGFATRYLARYPSGRWAALARRALDP